MKIITLILLFFNDSGIKYLIQQGAIRMHIFLWLLIFIFLQIQEGYSCPDITGYCILYEDTKGNDKKKSTIGPSCLGPVRVGTCGILSCHICAHMWERCNCYSECTQPGFSCGVVSYRTHPNTCEYTKQTRPSACNAFDTASPKQTLIK